jgi:hypothetical protein
MSFHDDYARVTPFELAFPDREAATTLMEEVRVEAEARASDPGDPGAFVMLGTVGEFLRELREPAAPADAVHQYAALVFHAYHFLAAGAPVFLVGTHVARYLVDEGLDGPAPPVPAPAGYVQLPRHLFWLQTTADGPAEAVDGLFWTVAQGRFHALLAVGLREGRPGLSVVPLPEAPVADMGGWSRARIREDGPDFSTTLPGGEMDGLLSLVSAGEVLKLAARLFSYLARFPGAVTEGTPGAGAAPVPSSLRYSRVDLHG